MNTSKITCDFLFKRFSISQLATNNQITKADIVKSILSFLRSHPQSSNKNQIKHKLKIELAKDFLRYPGKPESFCEEYGVNPKEFRKLMREVIDDYNIIPSDSLADKLFKKVMSDTVIVTKCIPKRIVKQIARIYVSSNHITQDGLASLYGTRRETIACILKRGISENILDDVTAEKVIVQVRSYNKSVDSYDLAFDERENHKQES